ncbi:hypothetical protein [Actinomadura sp. SCN-SB]|uniref:hypothetical protein n=1 Tax=Actinomadura sp. SCN-SB TaxID=3373092 RepID=UPI003751BD10
MDVKRLGLVLALAALAGLCPSTQPLRASTVDRETERQLTVAASTLVRLRSQALVPKSRNERRRRMPPEVLGVAISPNLARAQERALRELENRNRAPVEGGPAFTGARTRLEPARTIRTGDRITLEAIEHTEVRYGGGKVTQSIRRRFEFMTRGDRITLLDEQVVDRGTHPINDPGPFPAGSR